MKASWVCFLTVGLRPRFLTLGMMSFSFLSTNRPSLSSLFQFSCTTSGFSSKSSFLSSVTEKDYASQKITSLWTLNRVDWNQNKAKVQMGLIHESQTQEISKTHYFPNYCIWFNVLFMTVLQTTDIFVRWKLVESHIFDVLSDERLIIYLTD